MSAEYTDDEKKLARAIHTALAVDYDRGGNSGLIYFEDHFPINGEISIDGHINLNELARLVLLRMQ